jgi:hypothetical protein
VLDSVRRQWVDWRQGVPVPSGDAVPSSAVPINVPRPRATPRAVPLPRPAPTGRPGGRRLAPDESPDYIDDEDPRWIEGRRSPSIGDEGSVPGGRPPSRRPRPTIGDERPPTAPPAPGPGVPPAPAQPVVEQQPGTVPLWVHDPGLSEQTDYRYRLRLVLLNPLLTHERFVKDKQDAETATVLTPWSDWSEASSAPRATEFYAVSASPPFGARPGHMRVEVFTMCLGQRVRARYRLSEGEAIGQAEATHVVNPANGEVIQRSCDFDTGAVTVEFDFTREVRKGPIARTTPVLLYVDAQGRLRTQHLKRDLDDESEAVRRHARLLQEAQLTEEAVRRAAGG